jgi:hypothetical protein
MANDCLTFLDYSAIRPAPHRVQGCPEPYPELRRVQDQSRTLRGSGHGSGRHLPFAVCDSDGP